MPRACPVCDASNPAGAEWCSRCFSRFDAQAGHAESSKAPVSDPLEHAAGHWICAMCERPSPLTVNDCVSCGTPMFDSFAPQDAAPSGDPVRALAWSAIPGVGLAKAGQPILGLSEGILVVMAVASGVLLFATSAVGVALTAAGLMLWALSGHDAYRLAAGHEKSILVRPRVLSVIAGGVLGLIALGLVMTSSRLGIP